VATLPDIEHTTGLLLRFSQGDAQAQDRLYNEVCAELRRVAGGMMKVQAEHHTLQPTALVHEAWLRLVKSNAQTFENRTHFLGVASKAMRTVLVDHVRAKRAGKRGGGVELRAFDDAVATLAREQTDLLDLDEALAELERDDPELAKLVELRFFGGLAQPDVARVLGVSLSTVERMWRIARARLRRKLERSSDEVD